GLLSAQHGEEHQPDDQDRGHHHATADCAYAGDRRGVRRLLRLLRPLRLLHGDGHRASPSWPATTARISSSPTMPSSLPSSTTLTGLSAASTARVASRTTTSGPSSGPSRASSGSA